ncbi:Uncharacterised protein [uncultured archaeon]|nr:Uncharacterised protein [uncultured archaeon]
MGGGQSTADPKWGEPWSSNGCQQGSDKFLERYWSWCDPGKYTGQSCKQLVESGLLQFPNNIQGRQVMRAQMDPNDDRAGWVYVRGNCNPEWKMNAQGQWSSDGCQGGDDKGYQRFWANCSTKGYPDSCKQLVEAGALQYPEKINGGLEVDPTRSRMADNNIAWVYAKTPDCLASWGDWSYDGVHLYKGEYHNRYFSWCNSADPSRPREEACKDIIGTPALPWPTTIKYKDKTLNIIGAEIDPNDSKTGWVYTDEPIAYFGEWGDGGTGCKENGRHLYWARAYKYDQYASFDLASIMGTSALPWPTEIRGQKVVKALVAPDDKTAGWAYTIDTKCEPVWSGWDDNGCESDKKQHKYGAICVVNPPYEACDNMKLPDKMVDIKGRPLDPTNYYLEAPTMVNNKKVLTYQPELHGQERRMNVITEETDPDACLSWWDKNKWYVIFFVIVFLILVIVIGAVVMKVMTKV